MAITILNQSNQPFNQIDYVERYKEEFTLLSCMDTLMVDDVLVDP